MKIVSFLLLTLVQLWLTRGTTSDKPDPELDIIDEPVESRNAHKVDSASAYYNPPYDPANPPEEPLRSASGTRLVTLNELAAHGSSGAVRPLWLAIVGRVYDVDTGYNRSYGPQGGYNFFTGRDGSKAFVTGDFTEEGLVDDLSDLTPLQVGEIQGWVEFYDKDYTFVGKLIGRFYDETGNPTKYWYRYQKQLKKAEVIKADDEAEKRLYPPCNSRFVQGEGSSVSCSTRRYAYKLLGPGLSPQ